MNWWPEFISLYLKRWNQCKYKDRVAWLQKLALVIYPDLSQMYIHMWLDQAIFSFHTLNKVTFLILTLTLLISCFSTLQYNSGQNQNLSDIIGFFWREPFILEPQFKNTYLVSVNRNQNFSSGRSLTMQMLYSSNSQWLGLPDNKNEYTRVGNNRQ